MTSLGVELGGLVVTVAFPVAVVVDGAEVVAGVDELVSVVLVSVLDSVLDSVLEVDVGSEEVDEPGDADEDSEVVEVDSAELELVVVGAAAAPLAANSEHWRGPAAEACCSSPAPVHAERIQGIAAVEIPGRLEASH